MTHADVVIIGSGQGGVPLATALAERGRSVVLFERGALGGSCVNYGCTPSKAFLAAAHAAGRARRARAIGLRADEISVDFPRVMDRVRCIVQRFAGGVAERLPGAGVTVVHAEASFTGARTVTGGDLTVTAPLVIINTGTSALVPDIEGLRGTPFLTNATFFQLERLPRRTLVMGGGYIGLELGQGLARCGSEVHVFQRADRLLNVEEPDVSALLQKAFADEGMHLHLNADIRRVAYDAGRFTAFLADGTPVEGDALLVATGRTPNTAALAAARGGIELDKRGYVVVDEHFRTSCAGVYAIGDAAGQPAFTHVSWEDHRRLLAILDGEERTRSDRVLGYATYTEPQMGRAGLTLEQACKQGYRARAVTVTLDQVARAIEWNEERGFYRLVVDEETDRIIGATLVGYEAAELIHVFIALMNCGATWQTLDRSVHIHPTYAEALPGLARQFAEMSLATVG